MKSDFLYLSEKFSILIEGLIIGEGNSKQRMIENVSTLYMVLGLKFPEHLEETKNRIIKNLTKFQSINNKDESKKEIIITVDSYTRTIGKSHYKTVSGIIKDIYTLYVDFSFYIRKEK